jgi:hypothetical protein
MREYDDAALELRLRGVLTEHLGALPLDITVEDLERRGEVRRAARRRLGLVALGLAAALLVPLGVLVGGGRPQFEALVVPAPSASPDASATSTDMPPTASASPSIPYVITGPVSGPGTTEVTPGTYRLRGPGYSPVGWPSAVIVTIPDHWWAKSAARGAGLVRPEHDGEYDGVDLARLDVSSVGDLVARPCDGDGSLEPPIGPSVHDLVAGLISRPGLTFTEPVDTTIDGWPGVRMELTPTSTCGPATLWHAYSQGEGWNVMLGEGWRSRIEIVDVRGLRLVVMSSYRVDAPAEVRLELEQMVDSIAIEP